MIPLKVPNRFGAVTVKNTSFKIVSGWESEDK